MSVFEINNEAFKIFKIKLLYFVKKVWSSKEKHKEDLFGKDFLYSRILSKYWVYESNIKSEFSEIPGVIFIDFLDYK